MSKTLRQLAASSNHSRYHAADDGGHYESYYLRANHPRRPLAFWIRYTIFAPRGRPADAIGELWAVYFDGEGNNHVAAKTELPLTECRFPADRFDIAVGEAHLGPDALVGAAGDDRRIAWDMRYKGDAPPLFLLPLWAYDGRVAKAQSVVPRPGVRFSGRIEVAGETVTVNGWGGSQNHNWGSKHTDHYAFGQIAGFDNHPDSFLEVATARLKLGPVWSPFLTMLVLRHNGREYALNSAPQMLRATARIGYFNWHFASEDRGTRIEGRIHAPRKAFVGLRYYNPPGGDKHCLNTKIAACELTLTDKTVGATETLHTRHRALFEIIPPTTAGEHGIAIRA